MKLSKKTKIFLAGHKGMVGSAILKKLKDNGYKNIITRNRKQLDLLDQNKTNKFLKRNNPKLVIIAAAKVGGIIANMNNKSEFLYENLQIQNNLIHGSYIAGIKNLFLLGSSCIYPKFCKQPMKEEYLLTGSFEETNDAYALAKIAGIKMCEHYSKAYNLNYKSLMPPLKVFLVVSFPAKIISNQDPSKNSCDNFSPSISAFAIALNKSSDGFSLLLFRINLP